MPQSLHGQWAWSRTDEGPAASEGEGNSLPVTATSSFSTANLPKVSLILETGQSRVPNEARHHWYTFQ